jgi:hypothetical protein
VRERAVRDPVKSLLPIAAAAAALAGACSTGSLDPGTQPPEPTTVTFELRNDSASAVYLFQSCLVNLTITALADPPRVIDREGPCGCDCGVAACPVCGPCYQGSLEVAGGSMRSEYWNAVSVTYESAPSGSCERKHALPAGQYRIDVPVYGSADEAARNNGARIASQTFTLPAPADTVPVSLGLTR